MTVHNCSSLRSRGLETQTEQSTPSKNESEKQGKRIDGMNTIMHIRFITQKVVHCLLGSKG